MPKSTALTLLNLPTEIKQEIFRYLPLPDLLKLARTAKVVKQLTVDDPVLLKQMFFNPPSQVETQDFQDLDIVLWGDYHKLKPERQEKPSLHAIMQEIKSFLDKIDAIGESIIKNLPTLKDGQEEERKASIQTLLEGFVGQLKAFTNAVYDNSQEYLFLCLHDMEKLSKQVRDFILVPPDTTVAIQDNVYDQVKALLDKLKAAYLADKSSIRYGDHFVYSNAHQAVERNHVSYSYVRAIALTPAWHQLVLTDSPKGWIHKLSPERLQVAELVLPILKQNAFEAFIKEDPENASWLLKIIKLPKQATPHGSKIASKVYQHCLAHYDDTISKQVFDHYYAQYPEVFKHLSSNNDLELAQSMTVLSFNR